MEGGHTKEVLSLTIPARSGTEHMRHSTLSPTNYRLPVPEWFRAHITLYTLSVSVSRVSLPDDESKCMSHQSHCMMWTGNTLDERNGREKDLWYEYSANI